MTKRRTPKIIDRPGSEQPPESLNKIKSSQPELPPMEASPESPLAGITADDVLDSLIKQRGITSPVDRVLAVRAVRALITDKPALAAELMRYLPPAPVAQIDGRPSTSAHGARERLRQLVLAAQAADEINAVLREAEVAERDQTALEQAQARIASLEDENAHLRGVRPRRLAPPGAAPMKPARKKASAPEPPPPTREQLMDRAAAKDFADMDRVNSDRSAYTRQGLRPATHDEPWRPFVGPDGDISMRRRGGWGFP